MVMWFDEPSARDLESAKDFLELSRSSDKADEIVTRLASAPTVTKRAKDIIRSSGLVLLSKANDHVARIVDKAETGEKIHPILLVRGEPLIIADGYHRACAAYYISENTDVACRIVGAEDLASQAREAYAAGWAESGAPMTDRVRAGCVAAVGHALSNPDDPTILEVTHDLGALEGMWATLFGRREEVYTEQIPKVQAAWRLFLHDLPVPALVTKFREKSEVTESNADRKRHEAEVVAILMLLFSDHSSKKFKNLVKATETALISGEAEGYAAAIAIAAQDLGYQIDFDAAYQDMVTKLSKVGTKTTQAMSLLNTIAQGLAFDIVSELMFTPDASEETMISHVENVIDDAASVDAYSDQGISSAFIAGILSVYGILDVSNMSWITVGDERVCAACEAKEAANPYPADSAPVPPGHMRCRCILVPDDPVSSLKGLASYIL